MPYIPNTDEDRREMLAVIGVKSLEELFATIPDELKLKDELNLPAPMVESELYAHMKSIAMENVSFSGNRNFAGAGVYLHYIPAVVKELVRRGEFYTSYTPYQAEVSQGLLQAIFEYQSYICALTGMDATNASSYDGSTALVDAVVMAKNITRNSRIILLPFVHPQAVEVLQTYNIGLHLKIENIDADENGDFSIDELEGQLRGGDVAAVVLQVPNFMGFYPEGIPKIINLAHNYSALVIMSVYPFVLGSIKSPGELGVDIAVGEGQPMGIPSGFGGPLLGFIATKESYLRYLPGRIIGRAKALNGRVGYVMTLQAREQHIRREKATSSICTNQALVAIQCAIYLGAVGKDGFHKISRLCEENAHYAYQKLTQMDGINPLFQKKALFNEFALEIQGTGNVDAIYNALLVRGWLPGVKLGKFYPKYQNGLLLAFTELHSKAIIDEFCDDFEEVLRN